MFSAMREERRAFEGRTVVITGAAGGIGRALALGFADAGAQVAVLDVDGAGAAKAAGEVTSRGARAFSAACDVRDAAACAAAIGEARRALGPVDVLVNNAGISHRSAFAETDLAVIRRVMDVNFFGAVNCTKAAIDDLIARRGQVVAVSSVAGFGPLVLRTGYSASKHALHGFFDSLRSEVGPQGVGVLLACPSFARTAIDASALGKDGLPVGGEKRLVGRQLEPEEVAAAILKAAARREDLVLISPVAKASWWLSRMLPKVYEKVMLRAQEQ